MRRLIAVVEDEMDLLIVLREVLEGEGYDVLGFSRPNLVWTMEPERRPDLFLIDMMLPGMDGMEVAERLRSTGYAGTPMVAMSASARMLRMAEESRLFQGTLTKPFELIALVDLLEDLMGRTQSALVTETLQSGQSIPLQRARERVAASEIGLRMQPAGTYDLPAAVEALTEAAEQLKGDLDRREAMGGEMHEVTIARSALELMNQCLAWVAQHEQRLSDQESRDELERARRIATEVIGLLERAPDVSRRSQ